MFDQTQNNNGMNNMMVSSFGEECNNNGYNIPYY